MLKYSGQFKIKKKLNAVRHAIGNIVEQYPDDAEWQLKVAKTEKIKFHFLYGICLLSSSQ